MTTLKPVSLEFDQVVKGNVDIKQLSKKKYKITFSEISKFLKYQVWSDSSRLLNENRKVFYQKAKLWVQDFNKLNASLKASDKPLFKPTTVMEIGFKKYLFVLDKAKLNSKGHVVFKVSTEEIKLSEKKLLKLPRGHHDGVRFDIDSRNRITLNVNEIILNSSVIGNAIYDCTGTGATLSFDYDANIVSSVSYTNANCPSSSPISPLDFSQVFFGNPQFSYDPTTLIMTVNNLFGIEPLTFTVYLSN